MLYLPSSADVAATLTVSGAAKASAMASSTMVAGLIAITEVDLLVGVGVVLISAVALGSP